MTTYDLGQGVNLTHTVYDRDGALTAATVALTVTRPDGTAFTPPTVTTPSTGVYRAATFVPDALGTWTYLWTISGTVTDVEDGTFTVQAVAVREYADLPTVKDSLGKTSVDDRDDLIEQAIRSASRMIDDRAGRRFWLDAAVSSRRLKASDAYLDDNGELHFGVPDIGVADGLVVEEYTTGAWVAIDSDDYDTDPDTAPGDGRPITDLYGLPGWLPSTGRIRVTARWGWPSVPESIVQATVLLASRLYRRKDSPQGVLGNAEWGAIRVSRMDPDVESLVAPFILI